MLYGLTIALAVALYRRLGLTDSALVWSIVFLGLDGAYAASVGWIAARNTLLAAAFGLASILALVRARREQRSGFLAASYFAFAPLERVAFRFWTGTVVAPWTPPSIGATTTVPASSIF